MPKPIKDSGGKERSLTEMDLTQFQLLVRQDLGKQTQQIERLMQQYAQYVAHETARAVEEQLRALELKEATAEVKPLQQQPEKLDEVPDPVACPSTLLQPQLRVASATVLTADTAQGMPSAETNMDIPGMVREESQQPAAKPIRPNEMIQRSKRKDSCDTSCDARFKPPESFETLQKEFGVRLNRSATTRVFTNEWSRCWFFSCCSRLARTVYFEPACSAVMMCCALIIGIEADWSMQNYTVEEPLLIFRILDITFNSIFTLELIVRWGAAGWQFIACSNPAVRWNLMDILLVGSALLEELMGAIARAEGMDLSSLRLLRMMRLVRVMRIIRVVRFFSELRVMVNGILGSAKSLLWALVLLMLVMFLVGVTIMQFTALWIKDEEQATVDGILEFYGSLPRTIITLYMAISGGIDWRDAVSPLTSISIFLEFLFAGYVFFTVFCCLNIVTGIFVDNAKILKQADEDAMFQEAIADRKRWIAQVADLFAKVDANDSGSFGFLDFQEKLQDVRVQTIFRKLGINTDTTSAEELWEILDMDGNGNIDQDEFAQGIRLFQGMAKSIDLYRLKCEMKRERKGLQKKIHDLADATESLLSRMQMSTASRHRDGDTAEQNPLPAVLNQLVGQNSEDQRPPKEDVVQLDDAACREAAPEPPENDAPWLPASQG